MTSYVHLWRDYLYSDACQLVTESNHYSEIFGDFIDDVVLNINQYIDTESFTGWWYNMRDYNVNQDQLGVKLNLIIEDIPKDKNAEGYIKPERYPEMIIHIDKKLLNNINKFKSTLLHELTHVIKVYIKNKNGLETNIETLSDELLTYQHEFNITFKNKSTKNKITNILKNIFYIITDNEQLATINGTCKYLSLMKKDDIHAYLTKCIEEGLNDSDLYFETGGLMTTRNAQVLNVLRYLDDFHFLNRMEVVMNKFENLQDSVKILVSYYLNKHGYIRKPKLQHINYDITYMAVRKSSNTEYITDNIKNDLYHVYDCICDNFERYRKKLCDAVYVIMEKNGMFLPINEIYQIVPEKVKRLYEEKWIEY